MASRSAVEAVSAEADRVYTGFSGSPAFARAAASFVRCSVRLVRQLRKGIPSSWAFALTAALLHFSATAARKRLAPCSLRRFNFWASSSVHRLGTRANANC